VLLDLNLLRVFCAVVGCQDVLRGCALRVGAGAYGSFALAEVVGS
jgi:hypothetical protein